LEAATELFLIREYGGTSMEDIASAAAVSKQTVYKHFKDKQTLFREVALGSVAPAVDSRPRWLPPRMLPMCRPRSTNLREATSMPS
jgi:AcrR family transcriptional regulator